MFKINKTINQKEIWVSSMIGMTYGFFATLILGTIIGLFGKIPNMHFMYDIKNILSYSVGFGIGIGVGIRCGLKPLQIFSLGIAAMIASVSMLIPHYSLTTHQITTSNAKYGFFTFTHLKKGIPGDILSSWLISVLLVYLFRIFEFKTYMDIFFIPLIGLFFGMIAAGSLTFITSGVVSVVELIVDALARSSKGLNVLCAPLIGMIMGLALTLPTSSAAIAIMLHLHGAPASAAMAATAAQMVAFAVMTWKSNKTIGKTLAVGLGTSMLHMQNIAKKPKLLIIPVIVSMIAATCAVGLPLEFPAGAIGVPTSGMGTAALYGPIFTLFENGWTNYVPWIHVLVMQITLPILITIVLWWLFKKMKWINESELKLNEI
ncbi:PTS sugar transporter subunit IIC [Mycoplasma todarodis]|uniref:PTS sugar transporter subunit IIC n=1 Tax=Mycoplasma todarodis TaxID=1937191 RepID=UPI003B2DC394